MIESKITKVFTKCHIRLDIFHFDLYFTESKEEFELMCKWLAVEAITNVAGRTMLNVDKNGVCNILIGLFNADLDTLVHECSHASLYVLNAIGQKLDYEDELLPYLNAHIFKECRGKMK